MNRDEYLKALKNEIQALTTDEQAEALQYYSDYFEEANDDEKVMAELGSPEELAKTITEKFANAVVPTGSSSDGSQEEGSGCNSDNIEETVLYYGFDKEDVRNLDLSFGIADVVMIKGQQFSVETRGLTEDDFNCHLSAEGTLTINNVRKVNLSFFSHDRSKRFIPRILITVPDGALLNRFRLRVGAGNFRSKEVAFSCREGILDVGAGNLVLSKVYGGEIDFDCGMGNLQFVGSVGGKCDVDCGMGNIKLDLAGNEADYSYDLNLGLGDFKLNDQKKGGFYQSINNPKKANHFSVNCGMGSVNIKIN